VIHVEDYLVWLISRKGDPYVFGAENAPGEVGPGTPSDCSELLQWGADSAGVVPRFPDGTWYQWAAIENAGLTMTVEEAIDTRGAWLGIADRTGFVDHCALSLGDGTTIEARGRAWGIGSFTARGRFNRAGRIPGIDYNPRAPQWPSEFGEDDEMRQFTVPLAWRPVGTDGREPFLVVSEVPNNPRQFTVTGVNGGEHGDECFSPRWFEGQQLRDSNGLMYAEDGIEAGLWFRRYLTATGRIFNGGLIYDDHVVIACEGGGTYEIARG